MLFQYAILHLDITKVLRLAVFIPQPTVEVERTFNLMKIICTRTRKGLSPDNLGACMRICKYKELFECNFQEIMDLWLEAEDTASKKHSVSLCTDLP